MTATYWIVFLTFSLAEAACPTDTVCNAVTNRCYKFVNSPTEYAIAEEGCISAGGHLVSIQNAFENFAIGDTAQSMFIGSPDYWIGYNQLLTSNWTWTDGSDSTYTNWYPGEPAYKECASGLVGNSLWTGSLHDSRKPYVCALPYQSSPSQAPPTSGSCPVCPSKATPTKPCTNTPKCDSGWTFYEGAASCYKVILSVSSFEDAERSCVSKGAHLTSIHSEGENDFITEMSKTGYKAEHRQDGTFIGLRNGESGWEWTDGTKVDFTLWHSKSHSSSSSESHSHENRDDRNCAQLNCDNSSSKLDSQGYWKTYDCDSSMRAAVCKKSAIE